MLPRVASLLWRYADYFQLLGSQMPSCHGKAVYWLPPVPLCPKLAAKFKLGYYLIDFPLSAPGESLVWKAAGVFPTQITHHLGEWP